MSTFVLNDAGRPEVGDPRAEECIPLFSLAGSAEYNVGRLLDGMQRQVHDDLLPQNTAAKPDTLDLYVPSHGYSEPCSIGSSFYNFTERYFERGEGDKEYDKHQVQYSPYDPTRRWYAANSEWWCGGATGYLPPNSPSLLSQAYHKDSMAQHLSIQNGVSPKHRARWNRELDTGVTNANTGHPYPSSSITLSSSPPGSNADSRKTRKTRKRYTDSVRSKALIHAKHRFKTLFPVSTLLEAGETVVRVCKYMMSTQLVPKEEWEVEAWWWSNQMSAAGSPLHSERCEVQSGTLLQDKLAQPTQLKREADARLRTAYRAVCDELRMLFGPSRSLLDTMDMAYEFLVYGKECGVVPDITVPSWRGACALMDMSGPFFK